MREPAVTLTVPSGELGSLEPAAAVRRLLLEAPPPAVRDLAAGLTWEPAGTLESTVTLTGREAELLEDARLRLRERVLLRAALACART